MSNSLLHASLSERKDASQTYTPQRIKQAIETALSSPLGTDTDTGMDSNGGIETSPLARKMKAKVKSGENMEMGMEMSTEMSSGGYDPSSFSSSPYPLLPSSPPVFTTARNNTNNQDHDARNTGQTPFSRTPYPKTEAGTSLSIASSSPYPPYSSSALDPKTQSGVVPR